MTVRAHPMLPEKLGMRALTLLWSEARASDEKSDPVTFESQQSLEPSQGRRWCVHLKVRRSRRHFMAEPYPDTSGAARADQKT
jgi:hypothetical protein